MAEGAVIGSLLTISRFPVKSMQGESLQQADVDEGGGAWRPRLRAR